MFVSRVLDHWRVGEGSRLNPMRKTALTMVKPIESIELAVSDWGRPDAMVLATSAKESGEMPRFSFKEVREKMAEKDTFLVFGTGFGLAEEALNICQGCIEPIRGVGAEDYRHLSVRSAVSICLDRLRGSW